ncbi:MAG: hypothetical protein SPI18_08740 [Prevotella sp.]|nr:hypothetical protein [Prevotella sp.]
MYYFIIFLIILITNFFRFTYWDDTWQNIYRFVVVLVFSFLALKNRYIRNLKSIHKWLVLFLTLMPLVSVGVKQMYLDEALNIEFDFTFIRYALFPLFFLLWYKKVMEATLIKAIVLIGLVTFCIQVYQVVAPEGALFGAVYNDAGELAVGYRNNLARFSLGTQLLSIFCVCFYWDRLLQKATIKNILLFSCFAVSVYLYLTRQFMISVGIMLLFGLLMNRRKFKASTLFLILCAILFVYFFFEQFFGAFINLTQTDTYSVDVRNEAIPFFIMQSVKDPIMFLFGHGGRTSEMVFWGERLGYWYSDIGFIGQLYQYGLIWVLVFFWTIYMFIFKYKDEIPNYLRYYVIAITISSITFAPYCSGVGPFIWVCLLYIADLYLTPLHFKKK